MTYYTAVRWLSCGKVLFRFFQLRHEIDIFLTKKDHSKQLFSNREWLWKSAIFADLVNHMKNLNLKLQGENNLICDFYTNIKAFRAKLLLLESQINNYNFTHAILCRIV